MSVEKHTIRTDAEMIEFLDRFVSQYRDSRNIRAQWKAAKAKVFLEGIPDRFEEIIQRNPDIFKELM